jgi:hypothetical protein
MVLLLSLLLFLINWVEFVSYGPGRSSRPVRGQSTEQGGSDDGSHSGAGRSMANRKLCVPSRKTSVAVVSMRYPQSALFPSKSPTAWVRFASDRYI